MRFTIKYVVAYAAAAAVAATTLVAGTTAANAYTGNPPWVGTANDNAAVKGGLTFLDAAGNTITSGSDFNVLPAFLTASSAKTVNATKANLLMGFPQSANANPGTWLQQSLQGSTTFSPAPAGTPSQVNQANPFLKINLGPSPTPIADALGNNAAPDTTAKYAQTYELRLLDTGVGATPDGKYWRMVIEYNDTAAPLADGLAVGAWQQIYPVPVIVGKVTSLTTPVAAPASPVAHGTAITLTSTLTASDSTHPAGGVHFFDGATDLGAATFNAATGVATQASFVPADGAHSYVAKFTSVDTTAYQNAESAALAFTVNPLAPVNSSAPAFASAKVGVASICSAGTWSGSPTLAYAWYVGTSTTPFSRTASSGVLSASLYRKAIHCTVTATNAGGSASASSAARSVAAGAASKATVRPKIVSKKYVVGATLAAFRGVWKPAAKAYQYVWKRGKVIVSRAAKYKATKKDKGKTLVLYVYALRTGYVTGTATSAAVKIK
jgi:hypothetical protein